MNIWEMIGKGTVAAIFIFAAVYYIFKTKDEPQTPYEKMKAFWQERAKTFNAIIIALLISFTAQSQSGIYAWTANPNASRIHQYKLNGYDGVRIIVPWYTLQPTEANLSFSVLKTMIKQVSDSGLNMEIHVWAGPDAPISGGVTWLKDKGVETFNTTGGAEDGPWPNYYNSIYIAAYNTLHHALADTLFNLPSDQKAHVKSVFVSSAHTGDPQPWKGTPTAGTYGIANDDTWKTYYKNQWLTAYGYYQKDTGFMRNTFNPGNNAECLNYCFTTLAGSYLKYGDASHIYPVDGETYQVLWPDKVYIGEVDDDIKTSTNTSTKFQLVRSALSLKTDRLDFFDVWNDSAFVPALVDFFHKYYNQYTPATASKGFCALAGKIDFLNTIDYPTSTYGALYTNQNLYNGNINAINKSSDDTYRKQQRYVGTAKNNYYTARMLAIKATASGPQYSPNGPYYNNDIAFYVTPNYGLNVTQIYPFETSTAEYRIDAPGSIYGRAARKIKPYAGSSAFYFDIDDNLKQDNNDDDVNITVTYKDSGFAVWEIQCWQCLTKRITNTNTNTWKQTTLSALNFKWGNKMKYNSDFVIELKSGIAFPIDMVEVENLSK